MMLLPIVTIAQEHETGIKWTTGLSWDQIKQKAKAENKYIFLDCFATWCGPCKMMDKNVYTADSVGHFFNEKFIAVKVQMDKTQKDDESVKKWYADADSINKQYHIEGYPTFLFFNPNGQVTEKKMGYIQVGLFLAFGKSATAPGKLYDDPYADYYKKIAAYKAGERNYDTYPSMITTADKLGDTSTAKQLARELTDYVSDLPPKERYTKERIEFWNNNTWLSNTRVFGFFYKDARLINKVMTKKSYAESFVDRTIQYEISLPFMKEQSKESGIAMDGGYLTYMGTGPGPKTDSSEADWGKLYNTIKTKYGSGYAKRNVLSARVEWYERHRNKAAVIEYSLKLFNQYPPDFTDYSTSYKVNGPAWDAFLSSTDKNILKSYAKLLKKVIDFWPRDDYIDTYANLLYKLGDKRHAIEFEEKAIQLAPKDLSLLATLEQMKNGKPTYLNKGAIWKN